MNDSAGFGSRLVLVHAVVFATGALATLVGIVTDRSLWLLVAGPCLGLSGVLILVGSRVTFAGPTGALLRAVLGPARVRGVNLRAFVWLVAGILVFLLGLRALHRERDDVRPLEDPLVQRPAVRSERAELSF